MGKAIQNTLLIDDNKTTNLLNQLLLLKHGCFGRIHTAINGKIALDKLGLHNPKQPYPDIIFLDLDMPGIDGWDFLDRFSKLRKDNIHKITIIVLTSLFTYEVLQKAKENTIVKELINKPLKIDTVNRIYTDYFGSHRIKLGK